MRHRNCGSLMFAIAIIVSAVPSVLGQFPPDAKPQIAVLASPAAQGTLDENRAELALWYSAVELGVSERPMPRIIVVHGCPHSAHVANLDRNLPLAVSPERRMQFIKGSMVSESVVGDETVWYMWIVGEPKDEWIAAGMLNILRFHFGILTTRKEYERAARRIASRFSSLVTVDKLRKQDTSGPARHAQR